MPRHRAWPRSSAGASATPCAKRFAKIVHHHLSEDDQRCPRCGGIADRPRPGKQTVLYEYVPGYFVRQTHVQEKAACRCGEHIATAEPPRKPFEGSRYGACFVAHLVVMKCADSIPLHRLAKQYQRLRIPMSRRGFVWTFVADNLIAYRFSPDATSIGVSGGKGRFTDPG